MVMIIISTHWSMMPIFESITKKLNTNKKT